MKFTIAGLSHRALAPSIKISDLIDTFVFEILRDANFENDSGLRHLSSGGFEFEFSWVETVEF